MNSSIMNKITTTVGISIKTLRRGIFIIVPSIIPYSFSRYNKLIIVKLFRGPSYKKETDEKDDENQDSL